MPNIKKLASQTSVNYDFHSHTHFSDGALSPKELVMRAIDKGVNLLAITDHDSISGLQQAHTCKAKNDLSLDLINGIELSANSDFCDIHIVGLGIDTGSNQLNQLVKEQKIKRWERAENINKKLKKSGIDNILELIKEDHVDVITRSHFAQKIIKLGFAKDNKQVFKRFLGRKGKAKAQNNWESLENCIRVIQEAGGLAVLAHPTRYALSNRKLSYLIEEFKIEGGDGIEVSYPSLNPDQASWLEMHRAKNDLLASAGSDFHYPDLKWSDLGRFREVKKDIPHVLDQLLLNL